VTETEASEGRAGTYFAPSREDGRSDARVIADLVGDSPPDTQYTFDQLINALGAGLGDGAEIEHRRVYPAVGAANRLLLRERRRYLGTVRGVGYRVLPAGEMRGVAVARKTRANRQIQKGREVLEHTRLDELDPTQRRLHEGQLLLLQGLCRAMDETRARQDEHESLITDLRTREDDHEDLIRQVRSRVERLEHGEEGKGD
jgi:hypothetical protein